MIHNSGFWIFLISLRANVLVEASEQNFALAFCCGQNPKSGMATRENSRRSRMAHESTAELVRRYTIKQSSDSNTASTFVAKSWSKFEHSSSKLWCEQQNLMQDPQQNSERDLKHFSNAQTNGDSCSAKSSGVTDKEFWREFGAEFFTTRISELEQQNTVRTLQLSQNYQGQNYVWFSNCPWLGGIISRHLDMWQHAFYIAVLSRRVFEGIPSQSWLPARHRHHPGFEHVKFTFCMFAACKNV